MILTRRGDCQEETLQLQASITMTPTMSIVYRSLGLQSDLDPFGDSPIWCTKMAVEHF